jgi:hypothetical protein
MNAKRLNIASVLVPSVLACTFLGVVGCNATVTNGDPNGKGTGELEISPNTIAILHADLPGPGDDPGGTSAVTTTGGSQPDPNGLVVMIASDDLSCDAPPSSVFDLGGDCPNGGAHIVRFTLAPEQQAVGVYSLQSLNGFADEILENGDGTCGFGGGTFWDGQVEVTAVHADTIEITVSGTNPLSGESIDGDYVVPRCSDDPPPPPSNALAIFREDIPPYDPTGTTAVSVSSGGGGDPPGDDLILVASSASPQCSDPYGSPGCAADGWAVFVSLPAAYQTPGVYSLSDPAINSHFSMSFTENGQCAGGGGGSYWDGSIEVVSIDAEGVTFVLSGTAAIGLGFGNADGSYGAPICQ